LAAVFGGRPALPVLVESSTESEWVAQYLEELGQEVMVADPNYLPMYGARTRRVKTDKRDVAALAEACRLGTYRRAHRASASARALRRTLRVRRQLVRQRSALIHLLRALLRQEGVLDDPARLGGRAARASAFIGVVPREDSSGERRQRGAITKTGPSDLRALLVQASWGIWRSKGRCGTAFRRWAHALAERRGRRVAVVALARRLSRMLLALWRDGTEFREPAAPAPAA
jgi:transposase